VLLIDHSRQSGPEAVDLLLQESHIAACRKGRHSEFPRMGSDDAQGIDADGTGRAKNGKPFHLMTSA
jgi:hypothetical protein